MEGLMKIHHKLLKPITEVSYLRADNASRYRVIVRYFYDEYEKINNMLYREDIYEMMLNTNLFEDYTEELCQSDLNALVEWGNLIATQDSSKVSTLEEFRNRKFRYQLSEYTIEIERMTQVLENLEIEGASLEPTLLERIRLSLEKIEKMSESAPLEVSSWWKSINDDFVRLNRNYQDYIRILNGVHAEEIMMSKEFILFKDRIIQYLRTFVKGLQEEGVILEKFLKEVDPYHIKNIIDKVVKHESTIPILGRTFEEEKYRNLIEARWQNLYKWFVPTTTESEMNRLSDITLEIIRKITRYAQQIGEFYHKGSNRKEEYRHLVKIFDTCDSLDDAHKLSAMVFGVETSLHLKGLSPRDTDSIQSGVYEEAPTYYELEARARIKTEKKKRKPAQDFEFEKRMQLQSIIQEEQKKKDIIHNYINNKVIDFSNLPKIDSDTRKTLLSWLSRGLSDKDLKARTEWGLYFTVDNKSTDTCILKCEDGDLVMPAYKLIFEGEPS